MFEGKIDFGEKIYFALAHSYLSNLPAIWGNAALKYIKMYLNKVHSNGFSFLNKIDPRYATRITSTSISILDHVLNSWYGFDFYLKTIEPHSVTIEALLSVFN